MKIACSCIAMVLLLAGCATTGKVDEMIDAKMTPQVSEIDAQFEAQETAAAQTLEDMKGFVDRLGRTLNKEVNMVEADVSGLDRQVGTVKKDLSGMEADVDALKAEIEEMNSSDDGSVAEVIESLSAKIAGLSVSVEKLQKAEKARTEAETAAAEAKAALPAKGLFHKHPAGTVE